MVRGWGVGGVDYKHMTAGHLGQMNTGQQGSVAGLVLGVEVDGAADPSESRS